MRSNGVPEKSIENDASVDDNVGAGVQESEPSIESSDVVVEANLGPRRTTTRSSMVEAAGRALSLVNVDMFAGSQTRKILDKHFPDALSLTNEDKDLLGPLLFHLVVVTISLNVVEIGLKELFPPSGHGTLNPYVWVESVLSGVYFVEMCAKMRKSVRVYFKKLRNMLDFVVLFVSIFQVLVQLGAFGSPSQFLKLTAFVRLVRVIRLMRVMKGVPDLAITVGGLLTSMKPLVWVLFVLCLVVYIAALLFVSLIPEECKSDSEYWDGFLSALASWMNIILFGDSNPFADMLAIIPEEDIALRMTLVVSFYVFAGVGLFGVVNIIIGVIVDATSGIRDQLYWSENRDRVMRIGYVWEKMILEEGLSLAALQETKSEEVKRKKTQRRRAVIDSILAKVIEEDDSSLFPPGISKEEVYRLCDSNGDGEISHESVCLALAQMFLCNPAQQRMLALVNQGRFRESLCKVENTQKHILAMLQENQTRLADIQTRLAGIRG